MLQVSDAFTDTDITARSRVPACKHTGGLQLLSSGRELVPALGLAWANCVNTRIFLSRTELTVPSSQVQPSTSELPGSAACSLPLRYMQVVFSPCLPQDTCLCVVTQSGLQGIYKSSITQDHEQYVQNRQVDKQMVRQPLPAQQPLMPSLLAGDSGQFHENLHDPSKQGTTVATGVFAANF